MKWPVGQQDASDVINRTQPPTLSQRLAEGLFDMGAWKDNAIANFRENTGMQPDSWEFTRHAVPNAIPAQNASAVQPIQQSGLQPIAQKISLKSYGR